MKTYDVIISGAGPVGLFLACELALAQCSVLVLEKAETLDSPFKKFPFGMRGLSAPSIEALARRGLLEHFELHKYVKNPHSTATFPKRQNGHFAGIPLYEENIDPTQWKYLLPTSLPTSLLTEMSELETVLTRRAEELGVEIQRGRAVTDFQETADGVILPSGESAQWLVGCDGARSRVRKAGGFEFAGTDPEFTGYSAQIDLADPDKILPGRNLTATGMYWQTQPGYMVMLEFDGAAAHDGKPPTREQIQAVLRRVSGTDVTVSILHSAATWTDRARQATAYRKGRVLLAGDAAHIHSPLGGQGLNLGLGDAMNLGWKLAATLRGRALEGLLDTYHQERHPIGVRVLDWSRAQVAIMRPDPAARALNAIFRDLMSTTDGATYIAGRVRGLSTRYDLAGDHPLVGHSAPNFAFEDGTTLADQMHDGQGLLLDFEGRLEALSGVKHVRSAPIDPLGLRALEIRPDGIVAWAINV